MAYRVTVISDFDTETEAEAACSDMQEAAGKHDGDLQWYEVVDLDDI